MLSDGILCLSRHFERWKGIPQGVVLTPTLCGLFDDLLKDFGDRVRALEATPVGAAPPRPILVPPIGETVQRQGNLLIVDFVGLALAREADRRAAAGGRGDAA